MSPGARAIVAATSLPVSADLEHGFGDSPEVVAETIRQAGAAGLVGGSIEDSTGDANQPVFDFSLAVERVAAAADVLFAPALPTLESVRTVCAAVSRPVSFMAGIPGKSFAVADLTTAGVRRISVGTSFYRAGLAAFIDAAREVRERGTFSYVERALPT